MGVRCTRAGRKYGHWRHSMCAPQHSPSQPHYHKHCRAPYSIDENTSQNTENNNSVILTTYSCLHQRTIQTFRQPMLVSSVNSLKTTVGCWNVWIVVFSVLAIVRQSIKVSFPCHSGLYRILEYHLPMERSQLQTTLNGYHSHMLVTINQMYIFEGLPNGLVIDMLIRFNCAIKLMRNNNSVCNQFDCTIFYTCTHQNVPQKWLMFCCPHNVGTSGNWGLEQERAFVFALYVAMATSTSLSKVGPASPNHAYSHLTRVYAWTICGECMHELYVVSVSRCSYWNRFQTASKSVWRARVNTPYVWTIWVSVCMNYM